MRTWHMIFPWLGFLILSACLTAPVQTEVGSPEGGSTLASGTARPFPTLTETRPSPSPKLTETPPSPSPLTVTPVLGVDGAIQALAISPDNNTLMVGSQGGLTLVDRATWKVIWHSTVSHPVNSAAFSPDGFTLAATSDDGRITIWDVRNSMPVRILLAASGSAGGAAFSPDGRRFAAGSFKTIQLWDTRTWLITNSFTGHNNVVWRLIFTRDGRYLASASTDQTVLVWDIKHFQAGKKPEPAQTLRSSTYWVRSADFSSDGKRIAAGAGDGVVYVWDAINSKRLHSLRGEQGFIWEVAFSSDGGRLASASEDGSIVLWELKREQILRKWQFDSPQHSLLFDPVDPAIIAGGQDGKIHLIPLP